MDAAPALEVRAIVGMPEVQAGDDVAFQLASCLAAQGLSLFPGDVVVVSSKVVSKSMGLRSAGPRAEVVTSQTRRVVAERSTGGGGTTQVVVSVAGPVMAAAGVDASNTGGDDGVLLLPVDPDGAAAALRSGLLAACGLAESAEVGLVLSDTAGRPWRVGQVDFALGAAGLRVLDDLRGSPDADGRELSVTARAVADELAAAADLVKDKASGIPAVLVRGHGLVLGAGSAGRSSDGAARLVRTGPGDWFDYGRVEAVRAALGIEPGSAAAAEVGLPAAAAEPLVPRVARAIAVALRGTTEVGVDADPTPGREVLEVSAPDPYALGLAVARLQAALWSEGIDVASPVVRDTARVRLRLAPRDGT